VLTDDDSGHGFQHLAGPSHRPRIELTRGDCALARGLRNPDEVLGRILRICEVRKGESAGDRDVGAEGEMEDDVRARTCSRQIDFSAGGREVEQRKLDAITPRGHVKPIMSLAIRRPRPGRPGGGPQFDGNPWERAARFVANGSSKLRGLATPDRGQQLEHPRAEPESAHAYGIYEPRARSDV